MYVRYKGGRDAGDYWNAAYPFFNLIEPPVSFVQPYIDAAYDFAKTALVVFSRAGGENQDIPRIQVKYGLPTDSTRTYLELTTEEEAMLNAVKTKFDKTIVIVNTCNAMELGFLNDPDIDAAISISGCGQSGAISIAKILAGEINPSGRLADTYAYDLSTAATYANAPDCREINGTTGGIRRYTNSTFNFIY